MEQTKGDKVLIREIEELLAEAKAGEFGDFTNNKYAAPKMELRNKLLSMAENVIEGVYD
jgi:hypothetical protein